MNLEELYKRYKGKRLAVNLVRMDTQEVVIPQGRVLAKYILKRAVDAGLTITDDMISKPIRKKKMKVTLRIYTCSFSGFSKWAIFSKAKNLCLCPYSDDGYQSHYRAKRAAFQKAKLLGLEIVKVIEDA